VFVWRYWADFKSYGVLNMYRSDWWARDSNVWTMGIVCLDRTVERTCRVVHSPPASSWAKREEEATMRWRGVARVSKRLWMKKPSWRRTNGLISTVLIPWRFYFPYTFQKHYFIPFLCSYLAQKKNRVLYDSASSVPLSCWLLGMCNPPLYYFSWVYTMFEIRF